MRKIFILSSIVFFIGIHSAQAQGIKSFLETCGWGIATGATLGVVSLALEDQPGDSWNNVARGASLGLYAGMFYGFYQSSKSEAPVNYQSPDFSLIPTFDKGKKIDGFQFQKIVYSF